MIVSDLIEKLQKLPQDSKVRVWSADGYGCDVIDVSYDPKASAPHYDGVWIVIGQMKTDLLKGEGKWSGSLVFLAGLLISISEAIDKRWPGGETDKGDDTDEWLKSG